ncbi:hypothetical protein K504DRAFT_383363 [Pleomassaria siparia CBS 279.74]|uniref:RING-type domain-containing protein n=1 Tax=Pleomassaria siparia CBS 279.74 TaxID=1314801 RepID=A0A6G1K469_9PLEO|nr:hypothetical protein K504DRAFT_383363 [Pleomassaria siparia CBS 279.74]
MPTALLAPDPITPSISQRPGTSTSPSKSDLVLKALPALPPKTPQQSPLDKQHIALPPELPERVVISRARQVCHVCKEEKHIAHFSTWAPTTKCVHPPQTCLGCIQQCIATCIKTKGWDQCKCPECGLSLSHEDIKLFATQETFARYDHLSTRATLSNLPNFHWCQSPTCSSGQFHDERALNNLTFACESCGHMHCLNHHPTASYHAGETCIQYEARIASPCTPSVPPPSSQKHAEETADQQQYIIPCPNDTCSWFIENSEGCDKITCWKCKLEFCWECRAPFEPISRTGNSRLHNEGCKYWA